LRCLNSSRAFSYSTHERAAATTALGRPTQCPPTGTGTVQYFIPTLRRHSFFSRHRGRFPEVAISRKWGPAFVANLSIPKVVPGTKRPARYLKRAPNHAIFDRFAVNPNPNPNGGERSCCGGRSIPVGYLRSTVCGCFCVNGTSNLDVDSTRRNSIEILCRTVPVPVGGHCVERPK